MIEHIGCLCAELEPCPLPYLEILENGQVVVRETRSVQRVSRSVPKGIVERSDSSRSRNERCWSNRKRISTKVDTRSRSSGPVDSVDDIVQTAVRFGLVHPAGALCALVQARTVVAKLNVIGKTALYVEDGVDLPAAHDRVREAGCALEKRLVAPERQLVRDRPGAARCRRRRVLGRHDRL